jgi:hypothetical protein
MKEIEFFAHSQKTELPEKSASHRFSDEVYTFAKNGDSFLFATGKPKSIELAAGPDEKILAEDAAEVTSKNELNTTSTDTTAAKEQYYRLGANEDESVKHVMQTWKHLLNGNYTRWELLEGTIELAGAIALVRFGAKKLPKWFPSTPKPIVWPEVPTIMSSPIPGSIAKNHPIMRTIIRTNQVIEQTRPMV